MRKIITLPNPILRQKSEAIDLQKTDFELIKKLSQEMLKTMRQAHGIGLAAPQIGELLRLVVVEQLPGMDSPLVLINPKILHYSWRKDVAEEGCLSIPGEYGLVKRSVSIKCEFINLNNQKIKIKVSGLLARVIQHEVDHLNGILFIDKKIKSE